MARLSFRCDEEMVARVDEARGLVAREKWLRVMVERALEEATRGVTWLPAETFTSSHQPGPNVENVRSSGQAKRDTEPRPKTGK